MATITRPFLVLADLMRRAGACGNAGLIAGSVVGAILTLLEWVTEEKLDPSVGELVAIIAMLTGFAWLVLLFVFISTLRMPFTAVVLPTLVNALLVVVVTVLVAYALDAFGVAWLLGPLIGLLIGILLCFLARAWRGR
jgi:hypothetical protein